MKAIVNLFEDFKLYVKIHDHNVGPVVDLTVDIRECEIALVPDEVFKNRKRRWSKKFPIKISHSSSNSYTVYLFSPHAREKEDWYRRMKHANSGLTSKQIIKREMEFFAYMEGYFPSESFPATVSASKRSISSKNSSKRGHPRKPSLPKVRYSAAIQEKDESKEDESISIKGSPKVQHASRQTSTTSQSSTGSHDDSSYNDHQLSHTTRSMSSSVDSEFEIIPRPMKTSQLQWLNAVAARLCWDIWHEQRWKDWVTTRIQKKLIRVKTPSFMDQLRVTDVRLGNDMPVVQRLREGPKLDLRGIWVYLDVTYTGNFVMTIETKMKLGKESQAEEEPSGQQMMTVTKNKEPG